MLLWCVALSLERHDSKSREAAVAVIFMHRMYLAKCLDGANISLLLHALAHESRNDAALYFVWYGKPSSPEARPLEVGPTKALGCTMQHLLHLTPNIKPTHVYTFVRREERQKTEIGCSRRVEMPKTIASCLTTSFPAERLYGRDNSSRHVRGDSKTNKE